MRRDQKSDSGYASKWLPIAFPIIALLSLVIVSLIQPEPVYGSVLSVREGHQGTLYAKVEFTHPESSETVVEIVVLPVPYSGDQTIPLWPGNDWNPPMVGLFGRIELTPALMLSVAGVATLLGVVVQLTVRGFGYVPGTGKPGQTDPIEVAEDRGFYWRT